MTTLDILGATVLVVQPGERLVFVTTRDDITPTELDKYLENLKEAFPDNEVGVMCGIDQIVKWEAVA